LPLDIDRSIPYDKKNALGRSPPPRRF